MVSVVIPVYNVEKYLAKCIDSVIAQTYEDWEAILVNDGSTDSSLAICKDYELKDSRIRVISQDNKGLSGARNTGVKASLGEYIFFVDSDDAIDSKLLEASVKVAEYTNANIVQINLEFVNEDFTESISGKSEVGIKDNNLVIDNVWYKLNRFDLIQSFYNLDKDDKNIAEDIRLATTVAWTKLYKKAAFKDLLFPEEVRLHEDQMTAHRRIKEAGGMVFVNVPLYYYRQANNQSLIRTGWTVKRLAILDCYEDRLSCAEEVLEETGTSESAELANYIKLRTLVCFFRNYCMVSKHVHDNTKQKYQKNIINRMKKIISTGKGKLSVSKKLFFKAFTVMPAVFVIMFNLRNK